MPRSAPIQNSFNGGEFSPLLSARTDFEKYKNACEILLNNIPTVQGPYIRRPGFNFVWETKDSSRASRLATFEFSTEQAYIIEFGHNYLRFYTDNGIIVSGSTPYEIATSYLEGDLFDIQYAQSADVMFLSHPDYPSAELSRTSHTSWTITGTDFQDGPYLDVNTTGTTLTPSGTSGSITITASAVTGINNDTGFQTTDVGRLIRFKDSANNWTWLKITARASTTSVTADVKGANLASTTGTANWRLGLWSDTTGYPGSVTFYGNRLFYGGTPDYPQRLDGSRVGDYNNFAPTDPDGTVVDDHAVSYTLNADSVNRIRWMIGGEKALIVGTVGGEWLVRASNLNEALTPSNVNATQSTGYGSANVQPIRAGKAILFTQRSKRKIREMAYVIDVDGFKAPNMTILAEHVTKTGLKQLAYQQEPHSIMWGVREDGVLTGFTYSRDDDVIGWHRHILGGYSDAAKTQNAKVESVAVMPSADGTYDEVWVIVNRYINGSTQRYVEYLHEYWDDEMNQMNAFFLDSGLSYNGVPTTTLSGLDHLEGETVSILADGAVQPDKVVNGGSITLDREASVIHVGLKYNSDYKSLSFEVGSTDGTPQGKTKRIHDVVVRVRNTLGLKYGPNENKLDTKTFRKAGDAMDTAVPLFSGDIKLPFDGDYETQVHVYLRQDQPLPGTFLAVMPRMGTYDP